MRPGWPTTISDFPALVIHEWMGKHGGPPSCNLCTRSDTWILFLLYSLHTRVSPLATHHTYIIIYLHAYFYRKVIIMYIIYIMYIVQPTPPSTLYYAIYKMRVYIYYTWILIISLKSVHMVPIYKMFLYKIYYYIMCGDHLASEKNRIFKAL